MTKRLHSLVCHQRSELHFRKATFSRNGTYPAYKRATNALSTVDGRDIQNVEEQHVVSLRLIEYRTTDNAVFNGCVDASEDRFFVFVYWATIGRNGAFILSP
ncbi:hypothetical protein ASD64_09015 [Mesorhizobium sp. Root157]|nr:hypothetical protein ASD64_09015 [Mesorhizobium sp. Root157]